MIPKDNGRDNHEIRVTDRRRIYLDDEEQAATNESVGEPNLKPSYVEELEARTKAAESHAQSLQDRFEQLREQLQRDMDQTRQRLNRAADERAQRDTANFISGLLPVLDNLKRAAEAGQSTNNETLVQGVRRIAESFDAALRSAGVEPINAIGEPFDPELHEAVDTSDAGPEMNGRVVGEYTRGYKMGDRLLRPARVTVGEDSARADSARR